MKIKVFAGMRKYFDGREHIELDAGAGMTVSRLLEEAGLSGKVKCVVVRDGKALDEEDMVMPDDKLSLVRFVAGG